MIVIDFYATWYGPCKRIKPILAELEEEYKSDIVFYQVDVDKNKLATEYNITAMPTFVLLKKGKEVHRFSGGYPKDLFKNELDWFLKNDTPKALNDDFIKTIQNDWQQLNHYAWEIVEKHNDDKAAIQKGLNMVKQSIQLDENYYNLDTYAFLLALDGNLELAKSKAEKAIQLAKGTNIDTSSTRRFLKKNKKTFKVTP